MNMARPKNDDKLVILLPASEKQKIQRAAKAAGESIGEYVRKIIVEHFKGK